MPAELTLLTFLAGVISGVLGAVVVTWLTFNDALNLAQLDRQHRDDALRRALGAEVAANLKSAKTADKSRLGPIQRSAWDVAQGLTLSDRVFEAVSHAYVLGDRHNAYLESISRRMATTGYDPKPAQEAAAKYAQETLAKEFDAGRLALLEEQQSVGTTSSPRILITFVVLVAAGVVGWSIANVTATPKVKMAIVGILERTVCGELQSDSEGRVRVALPKESPAPVIGTQILFVDKCPAPAPTATPTLLPSPIPSPTASATATLSPRP